MEADCKGWRRTGGVLLLLLLAAALAAPGAAARERFMLGGGLATVSTDGDLDGQRTFVVDATSGPFIFPGELDTGRGIAALFGYAPLDWLALEALFTLSAHEAKHLALPSETLDATLSSLFFGGRFFLPVTGGTEVFARLGLGLHTLEYEENTQFPGSAFRIDSTLSGFGPGVGVGAAFFFDTLGLEFAVTRHDVTFDTLETGGATFDMPNTDEEITTTHVILVVQFGGER